MERVTEAAEAVGYVPNAAARSLRSRRTGQIAVRDARRRQPGVYDDGRLDPAGRASARLAADAALDGRGVEDELAMMRDLKHRFVDGMILASLDLTPAHAEELRASGRPVVVIGRPTKGTRVDMVRAYSRKGAAEAVRHLHGTGRRRIAFVNGPSTPCPEPAATGLSGRAALVRLPATTTRMEVAADFMVEPGRDATERLLERVRPTRSSARTTSWPSELWRPCATPACDVPERRGSRRHGRQCVVRGHVADADHGRSRLGRAGAARGRAAARADRAIRASSRAVVGVEPSLVIRALSGAAV